MTKEQLQELLQKEKAGTCTPAELVQLHQWYEQLDVSGSLYIDNEPVQAVAELSNTLLLEFRQKLAAGQAPVRRLRPWRMIAAAVLLLVVCGLWLVVGRRNSGKPAVVSVDHEKKALFHDVLPGGDRAILQLGDGSNIVLDSVADGVLVEQGSVKVIKLHDGVLAYDHQSSIVNREPIPYNKVTTPRGGQYQLTLPDGTKVWLNAASSIRFPTVFDAKERRVAITGEVYFEVSPSASLSTGRIPFLVNVNDKAEVEVLGTHFNINAYDDEGSIKTTLLEGKVKVVNRESSIVNQTSVVLSPGQQASIPSKSNQSPQILVQTPNIDEVIAWKNGLFKYQEADIQTILRQAARWYDVEVVFEGQVTAERFRGTIGRQVKLSEFLQILELNNIHFDIQGKKIIVKP
jgi:transmembrane sensor